MDPSYNNGFGSFGNGVAQQPSSVQQPSNAQQDIILTPSSEKKTKKWLVVVILLLVGLGLTAGVVALVMWKGNVVGGGNAVEDFKELVSYIEDVPEDYLDWKKAEEGDEGNEDDEDGIKQDWIYAVLVTDEKIRIRQDYYVEFNKKYKNFLNESKKEVSAELLEKYGDALNILENAMDYQTKTAEVFDEYEKSGLDGAKKYISEKLKCSTESTTLGGICKAEMEYYNLVLEEHIEMVGKESYRYRERFFSPSAKEFMSIVIKGMNRKVLEELNA